MNTSDEYLSALSALSAPTPLTPLSALPTAPTPLTPLSALPTALPDLHKEMFILGYCTELRVLRWLQYVYERDSRIYWNRILYPEVLEETLFYCDTDHIICREIEFHMENKDLELAFYRASGPSVRYKLYTKSLIITLITAI
jgi:hypothetical protein